MVTTKQPQAPPDLASVAAVLEELLPHGYQLSHTRHRWYVKVWDSFISNGTPRMGWFDVDRDKSLPALLARLREGPREQP